MPNTYSLIASSTLSTATATVTFSSIPQIYTDLLLKASARTNRGSFPIDGVKLQFNGVTTGYTVRWLQGDGSSAASFTDTFIYGGAMATSVSTANTFGNSDAYIPNYTSANYKSVSSDGVAENNAGGGYGILAANLWSNTAAITSIEISSSTASTLQQYSTFYLYGIKNS